MDKRKRSNLLLGLTALVWGMAFVAQSVGMDYVGPFTFNAARFLIGGMALMPCMLLMRRRECGEQTRQKTKAGVSGGICCGIALFTASSFQQFGIMHTTVGKAGFITALYIVIVPILGIFLKKKVTWTAWLSVGIAAVGMYLLCINGETGIEKGDFYVFLCAVCFSFHILIVDHVSHKAEGVFLSCVQFFTAGIMALVPAVILEKPGLSGLLAAWAPILYAGVMSCGVGYTLQVVAQKHTDPVVASLILSLESVFSLLAGWALLGQKMTARELFGCMLVFSAILLAQAPAGKKSSSEL